MSAYYNEIDPYAAQWLRNLIDKGLIAPGVVDERSIEDVKPNELMGYTQCHFFAGIGVWSLALRRAGWPDNRPIWTGSCPCQPFSSAGSQSGFEDARHLWPSLAWLIKQCGPSVVVGEQVASKSVEPWIDLVQTDLEALDYAFGCVPFPSAGVGAPHIRDRAYWVGHSNESGPQGLAGDGSTEGRQGPCRSTTEAGLSGGMADAAREQHDRPGISGETGRAEHTDGCADGGLANSDGCPSHEGGSDVRGWPTRSNAKSRAGLGGIGMPGGLGDTHCEPTGRDAGTAHAKKIKHGSENSNSDGPRDASDSLVNREPAGPTNGFWADADWLFCRDGKWRPVEPGSFPLANRLTSRVGRLRANWDTPAGKEGFGHRTGRLKGYGNAINAEAATVFIQSVMELLNSSASREFAAWQTT